MYLLNGKVLEDNGFVAGDVCYPPNWIAMATPEERAAIGIMEADEPTRPDSRMGSITREENGAYTVIPYPLDTVVANCCQDIDDAVAAVYTKWTRFQVEYDARKAAAETFKANGYQGDPGVYITAFATAAGLDNQTATDIVLVQVTMFAKALNDLGAARMRKFEVKRADTAEAALTLTDTIKAGIDTIAATIS